MKRIAAVMLAALMLTCTALPCGAEETVTEEGAAEKNAHRIEAENILQNPELPMGCEVTSLTILLRHLGYDIDKLTLSRNYLPKQEFYWWGGVLYGADYETTFAGDPEYSYNAYGCMAPCIVTTAENYLNDNGIKAEVKNLSGTPFEQLLSDYIDNDDPVLVWVTYGNLHETYYTDSWITPEGKTVTWKAWEHCVVLTGYDKGAGDNGQVYVSDPLEGNVAYDMALFEQRYNEMDMNAVLVKNEVELPYLPSDPPQKGDVNNDGSINVTDISLTAAHVKGSVPLSEDCASRAEVNGDGEINVADISLLAAHVKGIKAIEAAE